MARAQSGSTLKAVTYIRLTIAQYTPNTKAQVQAFKRFDNKQLGEFALVQRKITFLFYHSRFISFNRRRMFRTDMNRSAIMCACM